MTEITYNKEEDLYYKDGECLPRVTDILMQTGFCDVNLDDLAVIRAGRFGTAVHKACELWDRGRLDVKSLDPEIQPYLDAWKTFIYDLRVKIINVEQRLHDGQFQGKLDREVEIEERPTLIDIKTSTEIADSTAIQTAAYEILKQYSLNHLYGDLRKYKRLAVKLKPDGKYLIRHFTDRTDKHIFLSAFACYQWQKNNKLLKGRDQ